jgi:hypothetical protein
MKTRLLFVFLCLLLKETGAQQYTIATGTVTTPTSITGAITFGLKNTNPYPIKVTSISMHMAASATASFKLWYHTSAFTGVPNISTANGWVLATTNIPNPPTTAVHPMFTGLSFIIPANTLYRMAIEGSGGNVYYFPTGQGLDLYSSNGLELYTQDNPISPTYVGNMPTPPTTPRAFLGTIAFEKIATGTDNAGITFISPSQKFCGPSNQTIKVRVSNAGTNQITTVGLNWELDGVTQPSMQINGLLDAIGGTAPIDTLVELGTVSFLPNISHTLHIWTSSPNGTVDVNTDNDAYTTELGSGMSGTFALRGSTPDFTTFKSITDKINKFGICGPLTFNVAAGTTFLEPQVLLKNLQYPVTFQKTGGGPNPLVMGYEGIGTTDAVITISGSNNVVFDGIDVVDTPSTISNNRMEYGYRIINSAETKGSSNNIIKNCTITLQRANTSSSGIIQSASTTGGGLAATSTAGANHKNRYENIKVENAYKGITLIGTSGFPDSGCVITSTGGDFTIIGANTPNDIGNGTAVGWGVSISSQLNAEISGIIVRNVTQTGPAIQAGIAVDNSSTTSNYGVARIFNNKVYDITRNGSATATNHVTGIRIDVSPSASAEVYNNLIYNISSPTGPAAASANVVVRGIAHGYSTGTGNARYYNNTILIPTGSNVNVSSAAFWKSGTGTATAINNIYSNISADQAGVSKHYGFYLSGGPLVSSNNLFWTPNVNGFPGYSTSDKATVSTFAAASSGVAPQDGNEAGSAYGDPNFISTTNLDFAGITPAVLSGAPLSPAITTDFNGLTRSLTQPTIGAIETSQNQLDSSAPVITNVIAHTGATPYIYATVIDNGSALSAGSIMLWYRLGTSGIFSSAAPDSIPTGTMDGTYKWDNLFTSLTTGDYQFYIAARDQVGQGVNIAFNPIQAATFVTFATADPVNYLTNPDASVNVRLISKVTALAPATYTVGATGQYTNLTQVANVLNTSDLTGNVIFELKADYDGTTETFPVTFKQFAYTGGNWTATIRPAATTTGVITWGAPASSIPMITLDGVSNLILDGRPGGAGTTSEWVIRNRRAATTIASCINFVNNANKDSLVYLKLESASTVGTILFSTSTKTLGNKYNYIGNCEIRDRSDSVGFHTLGISSVGTATAVNDSNTIENNNIYNFVTTGVSISSTGNGNGWIINGNHFYSNRTPAASSNQQGINIPATTSTGHTISNNYIGGSQPFCGGTPWINTGAISFRGITLNLATTDSTYIRDNTIQNIQCTATGSGSIWCLELSGGTISFTGNTIGHPTNTNSILSNMSALTTAMYLQASNMRIDNNLFANITSGSTSSTLGLSAINSAVSGTLTITNNVFHTISGTTVTTSSGSTALRIIHSTGNANHTILNNTIYNIRCTGGPANSVATIATAVYTNNTGTGILRGNKVSDFRNSTASTSGQLNGFNLVAGTWDVGNNFVALGDGTDLGAIVTGILVGSSADVKLYHNTVSILGASTTPAGTQTSAAVRRTSTGNINVANNILLNTRTGGGANYVIANTATTPATGWKANYNDLYAANSLETGLWGASSSDFATWLTTSLYDSFSINTLPTFVSASDLHLALPTLGDITFAGKPLQGYEKDIDGDIRSTYGPYMGADESTVYPLPVKLTKFSALTFENDALLNWQTASESNTSHFEIERSTDGRTFNHIETVRAMGNSFLITNYRYVDFNVFEKTPVVYYRLRMIDLNNRFEYSNIVTLSKNKVGASQKLKAYPNPFDNTVNIEFISNNNSNATVSFNDITGKLIFTTVQQTLTGFNTLQLDGLEKLKAGIYFITLDMHGEKHINKLIKQ